jgi:hypothetical protein
MDARDFPPGAAHPAPGRNLGSAAFKKPPLTKPYQRLGSVETEPFLIQIPAIFRKIGGKSPKTVFESPSPLVGSRKRLDLGGRRREILDFAAPKNPPAPCGEWKNDCLISCSRGIYHYQKQ